MNPKRTVEQIRGQLVNCILKGPRPPSDEMALLSQEYQEVWQVHDETPAEAKPVTTWDKIRRSFSKSTTSADLLFVNEIEQQHRRKRWIESEQLASLRRIESLLEDNEDLRRRLLAHIHELSRRIDQCCGKAEVQQLAKLLRRNQRKLAKLDRSERKVLTSVRHNTLQYLDFIKRLETRQECGPPREAASQFDLFAVLGGVLTLSAIHDMARNVKKLAQQK